MSLRNHVFESLIGLKVLTRKGHEVIIAEVRLDNNRIYVKGEGGPWMKANNLTVVDAAKPLVQTAPPESEFEFPVRCWIKGIDTKIERIITGQYVAADGSGLRYYTVTPPTIYGEFVYAPSVELEYRKMFDANSPNKTA